MTCITKFQENLLIALVSECPSYIRLPRRYLFVGHVNRHLGAFAKRCINNRTIRHDAKGAVPIVHSLRKICTFGEVSYMQVIPFLCV